MNFVLCITLAFRLLYMQCTCMPTDVDVHVLSTNFHEIKWVCLKSFILLSGSPCVKFLNASTSPQLIQSTGFPNYYEPDLNCRWDILAPPSSNLLITIHKAELTKTTNCSKDVIKVLDTPEVRPITAKLTTFCLHLHVIYSKHSYIQ